MILASEGERDAAINQAEGEKQRVIKASEARQQQQINEAGGQAQAILAIATATAEGLKQVGTALVGQGGMEAMQLRVAEQYVKEFGQLARDAQSTLIVPANLSDIAGMISVATSVLKSQSSTMPRPDQAAPPGRLPQT